MSASLAMSIIIVVVLHFCIPCHSMQSTINVNNIDLQRHGSYPVRTFASSNVPAPYIDLVTDSSVADEDLYYFITPRGHKVKRPGPMILDANGSVIWSQHFENDYGGQSYDLRVQQYKGENYLTFWLGDDRVRGHGAGHYYMLNSSYDIARKVSAANGRFADLHEFTITPDGTALMIAYEPIKADVRPLGRIFQDIWNQAVWDCLFQEVDIETGNLILEWRASEHVNMTLTYSKIESFDVGTATQPFDWIHLNSIQKDELGNYLVSARNTHSISYIDGRTLDTIWTLGGKANMFQDISGGHALNFAWQHDARFVDSDAFPESYRPPRKRRGVTTRLMTLFDNAALDWNYEYGPADSRLLLLELSYPIAPRTQKEVREDSVNNAPLDETRIIAPSDRLSKLDLEKVEEIRGIDSAYMVRVIRDFRHPNHIKSSTQGSVQILPAKSSHDSTFLVGYGINAVVTEFLSNGSIARDLQFAARSSWETGDVQSYRAYQSHWKGLPEHPPNAVVRKGNVHVSWNGATEVKRWLLQTNSYGVDGDPDSTIQDIVMVSKTGFETIIPLTTNDYDVSNQAVRVLAIDSSGHVCEHGVSETISRSRFTLGLPIEHFWRGQVRFFNITIFAMGGIALFLVLRRVILRNNKIFAAASSRNHRMD